MSNRWKQFMLKATSSLNSSEFQDAKCNLEKALRFAEQDNDVDKRFETLTVLARTCRELGNWEEAEIHTRRMINMTINFHGARSREHGLALLVLAELYFDKEDFESSESTALECEELISKSETNHECIECTLKRLRPIVLLVELAARRGDMKAAKSWLEIYRKAFGVPPLGEDEVRTMVEIFAKKRRDFKATWFRVLPTNSVRHAQRTGAY